MTLSDNLGEGSSGPNTTTAQTPRRTKLPPGVAGQQPGLESALPVWVRAPKSGVEFYTGQSRAKLYDWAGKGYIRSVSLREPGQVKGVRVFHLASILDYIAGREASAVGQAAGA